MRAASDILVIDDEPGIVEFVTDLLTEEGYAVRTARDGGQALHEVAAHLPALLLMDWHMPGRSGGEVLRQLRHQGLHDLPIIVMSADAASGTVLDAGATAFLAKPFVLDELLTCINQHLLPAVSPLPTRAATNTVMLDSVARSTLPRKRGTAWPALDQQVQERCHQLLALSQQLRREGQWLRATAQCVREHSEDVRNPALLPGLRPKLS